MGIFGIAKRKRVAGKATMKPRPVTINPRRVSRIERARIRIRRCQDAMEKSTNDEYKAKMLAAIRKHRATLIALGADDGEELTAQQS